ncbi:MAG: hypothetical protein ABEI98_04310 [Halorhabdus sp.]
MTRTTVRPGSPPGESLRNRLAIDSAADGLQNFFEAAVELMKVMARAYRHDSLSKFERRDLTT